jgi:ELWxxDGT repeat protein
MGSTLFFSGYDSTNGYGLWRCMTEYTDSGMEVVNEITYS